jgi:putative peptide zinc metalloprotease protein
MMDKPLFSEHWYRVKSLRPRLRSHTRLHRHEYRGEVWYVMEDDSSGRYHRFNTAAYQVIGLMNGQRTVHQIWEQVNSQLGDDAPVQDDIIQMLGQLHQVDALQSDISPDVQEMFRRGEQYEQQQWRGRVRNPLALRLGLFDPDRFLDRTLPLVRWAYSVPCMLLWCLLVVAGALLAGSHWNELLDTARYEALTPFNLVLLWLVYPVIKLLHELGHAYAAKLEGGEVHEIGIMLLVFMPVPYVDASAATAFRDRRKRMLVGAAGVMVELLLAVLALFLWLNVEPGIVRSICFNVMLIGGVSTVLFNGNPLLRFDGYYVLADAVDIPNLAQRANKYLAYLVQRRVLGMDDARSPVTSPGEAPWFIFYSIASFCYRLFVMGLICLFLIDTFFVLGILLAAWAVYNQIALPLIRQLRFLLFDPRLRRGRSRALLASGLCLLLVAGTVAWVPVSSLTRFEGVIWPPDESQLVTETDGFVAELLQPPGATVVAGQPLLQLGNALHAGEMAVERARMRELTARFRAARVNDRVKTRLVQEEIAAVQGEIDRLQEKIDALLITSPVDGVFVLPQADDLPGQYLRQGTVLGYVVSSDRAVARVVVTQEDQDRIAQRLDGVALRLASDMGRVWPGNLLREVPQASNQLPSKVLSVEGGGPFTPDPAGLTALSTRERLFEFEIELPLSVEQAMIGTRVYVRFDHGRETLWRQASRRFRQLFLRRLNV